MFKKVLKNTFFQLIGKATTGVTTLVITIIIGRALGPAGYGDFTKIFVFVGYFYIFADFGLNAVFIKLTQKEGEEQLLKYLIGLRIAGALVLAVIASSVAILLPYNPSTHLGFSPLVKAGIILASLTILTQALVNSANAIFQKRLRYDFQTLTYVCGSIVILATIFLAAALKLGLLFYIIAYILQGIVFVIVAHISIKKYLKLNLVPLFSRIQFIKLLKYSSPIGLAMAFHLVYFRVDVLILSYTRPAAEIGLYGLAYQFFEAGLTVPFFLVNSIYPHITRLYTFNKRQFNKETKLWVIRLFLFSLAITAILYLVSGLIPTIYDKRFSGSTLALQILGFSMPFFFISVLLWHILIIKNKQKFLAYIYLAGAVFNIIVNLIFIPTHGYLAAAATTTVSELFVMVLLALALLI